MVVCRRVMVLSRSDVFGQWDVDWEICWSEMGKEPTLTAKGIRFELKVWAHSTPPPPMSLRTHT